MVTAAGGAGGQEGAGDLFDGFDGPDVPGISLSLRACFLTWGLQTQTPVSYVRALSPRSTRTPVSPAAKPAGGKGPLATIFNRSGSGSGASGFGGGATIGNGPIAKAIQGTIDHIKDKLGVGGNDGGSEDAGNAAGATTP